ncbi:hypothetical protein JRQ81_016937 [Phrynocephalus forsythii]|uniref:DDE-1 domain-containing protein n=1 Tax=Phrynocephalus forsythii TaxID=171643 RepID=A0A9Q0XTT8_9SAUR|nr:hypothetical protein JRQ81_016937 [Phrynocephalus forsythii]
MTHILFVQWVNLVFGPAVKWYLLEKNLPFKALLVVDNVPAHPPYLKEVLLEEFTFIKPIDQQVISSFKKLYTRELFSCCFEMTDGTSLTLHEYWRDHFDIVRCMLIINAVWDEVSQRNLNSIWCNLGPGCAVTPGAFAPAPESAMVQEIASLGRTMGLLVTKEDVSKLVEGQKHELNTQDLLL